MSSTVAAPEIFLRGGSEGQSASLRGEIVTVFSSNGGKLGKTGAEQWHTGEGRGGRVPPWHFSPGNFCWPTGKIEVNKKKKNGEEKKAKRRIAKGKSKGKKYENEKKTFFSFAFHFLKPQKFVWGVPKWKTSTGKKHISRRERIWTSDFAPSEKYSSYATGAEPPVRGCPLPYSCHQSIPKFVHISQYGRTPGATCIWSWISSSYKSLCN